jgi:pilus assembly protein Flp/PilA
MAAKAPTIYQCRQDIFCRHGTGFFGRWRGDAAANAETALRVPFRLASQTQPGARGLPIAGADPAGIPNQGEHPGAPPASTAPGIKLLNTTLSCNSACKLFRTFLINHKI